MVDNQSTPTHRPYILLGCYTDMQTYVHWVPLIWAAFLPAKSAHIGRKTLNQKYFNLWKAIWGSNILPK